MSDHAVFDHPNNIERGWGRIIYALKTRDSYGVVHPEGWVLPGGRRTNDVLVAKMEADNINKMTEKFLGAKR